MAEFPPDLARIPQDVLRGVAELLQKAAAKAAINQDPANRLASMAKNRFLLSSSANQGGVSALHSTASAADPQLNDQNGSGSIEKAPKHHRKAMPKGSLSPRILLIQASDDRSRDYNAMMNCAFAATKQNIVIDGCFIGMKSEQSSAFLEQACDLTGGIFLKTQGCDSSSWGP